MIKKADKYGYIGNRTGITNLGLTTYMTDLPAITSMKILNVATQTGKILNVATQTGKILNVATQTGEILKGECSVFKKKFIMNENDALSEYNKIPLGHNRTNVAVYSKIYFKIEICSAH